MTDPVDFLWAAMEPFDRADLDLVAAPATPEAVAAFEEELGFALPAQVREVLVSRAGGLFVGARDEVWPPAKEYDVGPAWTFWPGVILLGLGEESPDWASMRAKLAEVEQAGVEDFVPVLKVYGDSRLFGFDPDGRLLVLSDDGLSDSGYADFAELVTQELADLADRITKMKLRLADRISSAGPASAEEPPDPEETGDDPPIGR